MLGTLRPLSSSKGSLEINTQYQYEDNDIQAILSCRVQDLFKVPRSISKPIQVLAAVDNIIAGQLQQRLLQEKGEHAASERILLIPYNIHNMHWVILCIEFNKKQDAPQCWVADSLLKKRPQSSSSSDKEEQDVEQQEAMVHLSISAQIAAVYPNCNIEFCTLLCQDDATSCGVYAIENGLLLARHLPVSSVSPDVTTLRKQHLELLKQYQPDFYPGFYQRQKDNQPSTAALEEQLSYLKQLKALRFSKQELQCILSIQKCLQGLTTPSVRAELLAAFQPPIDLGLSNSHAQHYGAIREAFRKGVAELQAHKSAPDQALIKQMLQLLFHLDWQGDEVPDIGKIKYQVQYEVVRSVAGIVQQVTGDSARQANLEEARRKLEEQLKQDEAYAKKLQAQLWSEVHIQTPLPVYAPQRDLVFSGKRQATLSFSAPRYEQEQKQRKEEIFIRSLLNERFLLTKEYWALFLWKATKHAGALLWIEGLQENQYFLKCYKAFGMPQRYQGSLAPGDMVQLEQIPVEFEHCAAYQQQGFGIEQKQAKVLEERLQQVPLVHLSSSSSGGTSSFSAPNPATATLTPQFQAEIAEVLKLELLPQAADWQEIILERGRVQAKSSVRPG